MCNTDLFEKVTYEGMMTQMGAAQNNIIEVLTKIEKSTFNITPKGKLKITDLDINTLWLLNHELIIMKSITNSWIQERAKDKDRQKRAAGFKAFETHLDNLIPITIFNIKEKDKSVTGEEIEEKSKEAYQDERVKKMTQHYQTRSAESVFENLEKPVADLAPNTNSRGRINVEVDIPVEPTGVGFVGGRFTIEAKRTPSFFSTRVELALRGGVRVPAGFPILTGKLQVELGGYIESRGKDTKEALKLVSYGFNRILHEKLPQSFADFAWGGETASAKFRKTVEQEAFSKSNNSGAYIELGLFAGIGGKVGAQDLSGEDIASISADAKATVGKRYDKDTVDTKGKTTYGSIISGSINIAGLGKLSVKHIFQKSQDKEIKNKLIAEVSTTKLPSEFSSGVQLVSFFASDLVNYIENQNKKEEEKSTYEKVKAPYETYSHIWDLGNVMNGAKQNPFPSIPGTSAGLSLQLILDFISDSGSFQLSALSKFDKELFGVKTEAAFAENLIKIGYANQKWSINIVNIKPSPKK